MKVFYIVPAWSDQAGQCRIVCRDINAPAVDASRDYKRDPSQWKEAGLMNSRGKLVCLDDAEAFMDMAECEPLSAGLQFCYETENQLEQQRQRA